MRHFLIIAKEMAIGGVIGFVLALLLGYLRSTKND